MTYPLNEQGFINKWLAALDSPDDVDREFGQAIVTVINKAYYAGLAEGICAGANQHHKSGLHRCSKIIQLRPRPLR